MYSTMKAALPFSVVLFMKSSAVVRSHIWNYNKNDHNNQLFTCLISECALGSKEQDALSPAVNRHHLILTSHAYFTTLLFTPMGLDVCLSFCRNNNDKFDILEVQVNESQNTANWMGFFFLFVLFGFWFWGCFFCFFLGGGCHIKAHKRNGSNWILPFCQLHRVTSGEHKRTSLTIN